MYGAIAGDMIGSVYEFNSIKTNQDHGVSSVQQKISFYG